MPPSLVNRLCGKPSGNSKQFVGTGRKWRHTLQLTGALCKDTYRITTAPIKSTAPVKKTLKVQTTLTNASVSQLQQSSAGATAITKDNIFWGGKSGTPPHFEPK